MKKTLFSILVCILCTAASAQSTTSESTSKIALTPIVSDELGLVSDVHNALQVKTMQIVTRNGLGSSSGQFVITPNIVLVSKEATASAPVQFVVQLEVVFFVADPKNKIVVSQISIPAKGISTSENKAYLQAINSVNPTGRQLKMFVDNSRAKIADYYAKQLPTVIAKAEMLVSRNQYDQAMTTLLDVPEEVVGYETVAALVGKIYTLKINRDGLESLKKAEIAIAKGDYSAALDDLCAVDSYSEHSQKATELVGRIKSVIDAEKAQSLALEMKRYEASVAQSAQKYKTTEGGGDGTVVDDALYSAKAIARVARSASKDLINDSVQASKILMKTAVNEWSSSLFGK